MKPKPQSYTRFVRQFQSPKRQNHAVCTSVSVLDCKPLHGQYKFERNHEKDGKKQTQCNTFWEQPAYTPKIYCIEFALGKKREENVSFRKTWRKQYL